MSEFSCPVVRVTIETHPNADAIEIARVGDFQSIVRKGQFVTGDLVCYIPEQALVPENLLRQMNLWDEESGNGSLSGPDGNRVKAIRLRGVVSQGLVLGLSKDATHSVGENLAEVLGVTKYEPPIPSNMTGRIAASSMDATHKYDFENLKRFPDLFSDGDEVVITEKIHGTFICVGVVPERQADERFYKSRVTLASKGLGAQGFVIDAMEAENLYAQAAHKHGLLDGMLKHYGDLATRSGLPIFLMGEVFGCTQTSGGKKGIQDLTYTGEVLDFLAFDICFGGRSQSSYLSWDAFVDVCGAMGVPTVPMLYRGPYSKEVVLEYTDGATTLVAGKGAHIREGVVVKTVQDERHPEYGRKIAKSISAAYLLRKNATELQ